MGKEIASLSVVIPNFNGAHLLRQNLPSVVAALEKSGLRHEIIVADDCSTDDSVSFLGSEYPQIRIVKNETNRGFAKNINSGLKKATGSLVLCLNSDVSLDQSYFKYVLPFFDSPTTFGVMGALCNPSTGKVEDGAKAWNQSKWGQIRSTINLLPMDGSALSTFFLSGANALVDRKKLELLGFFDELFSPFYNEDVELGIRAWRMGWQCFFEPKARAFHGVSKTIQATASKGQIRRISIRNRFLLHAIHLEGLSRVLFFGRAGLDFLTRWLVGDFIFYGALLDFFRLRKESQKSRTAFLRLNPQYRFSQIKGVLNTLQEKKSCQVF